MLFNSYIFIFLFLPVCLVVFNLLAKKYPTVAKIWLIAMSLWFYGYFNVSYLAIMIFSILFNYAAFCGIMKSASRRLILTLGIAGDLGLLLYFKYTDFLIDSCNSIFKLDMPLRHILLPLGISFFTFQQIGFLADAYRGEISDCGFVDYALFVSFFPQLIAGPIADHGTMLPQYRAIGKPDTDRAGKTVRGITLFTLGLAKKVLIADTFGKSVDYAYLSLALGINSIEALLTVLFYALQLYFDFSGYCDMALGLGWMFGIDIPVNFDSPYKSHNIIEFWRTWHITLNKFMTKNVYIPLGGNRKGEVRTYVNLLLVFFISGIWHGAGWTFILWGLMHGIVYVITRLLDKKCGISCKGPVSHIFTFVFVCIAWVFFRADTIADACALLVSVFTGGIGRLGDGFIEGFNLPEFWYVLKAVHLTTADASRYILMFLFTAFGLGTVLYAPNAREITSRIHFKIPQGILIGALFVWCVVSLSGVSTFLYFNF